MIGNIHVYFWFTFKKSIIKWWNGRDKKQLFWWFCDEFDLWKHGFFYKGNSIYYIVLTEIISYFVLCSAFRLIQLNFSQKMIMLSKNISVIKHIWYKAFNIMKPVIDARFLVFKSDMMCLLSVFDYILLCSVSLLNLKSI